MNDIFKDTLHSKLSSYNNTDESMKQRHNHKPSREDACDMYEKGSEEKQEKYLKTAHRLPSDYHYLSNLYGLDYDDTSCSLSESSSSRSTDTRICKYSFFNRNYRRPPSENSDRFATFVKSAVSDYVGKPVSKMKQMLIASWLLLIGGRKRSKSHKSKSRPIKGDDREHLLLIPIVAILPFLMWLLSADDVWKQQVDNKSVDSFKAEVETALEQFETYKKQELAIADVEAIVHRMIAQEKLKVNADLNTENWKQMDMMMIKEKEMEQKYDTLRNTVEELYNSVTVQKKMIDDQKYETQQSKEELEDKLAALQVKVNDTRRQNMQLENRLYVCSQGQDVKTNILSVLEQVRAGEMCGDPVQDTFTSWLHSGHISQTELDSRMQELAVNLTNKVLAQDIPVYEHTKQEKYVKTMINDALQKYDADKLGRHDFALETAGGSIVQSRCSRFYDRSHSIYRMFPFIYWRTFKSARSIIQPGVHPGECWPFEGSTGYVVIETSFRIIPSGFTLEHIPKILSPTGEIRSAPKDFTVLGYDDENNNTGVPLGNFMYDDNGPPLQYFSAKLSGHRKVFKVFELKIHSNHGSPEYTCIYRFRIHGEVNKTSSDPCLSGNSSSECKI